MEHTNKRRNSILKKKLANDEDTTSEIKARRISFSGKKSVKEFIAGEEAATIWGTSYEESADDLKVHSTETQSGLVNVSEKRIVLRNRRVIVDPKSQIKRRSSIKKKIAIAENDKENVFVEPPKIALIETKPPEQVEPEAKSESPPKSELALVKSHCEVSKNIAMSKFSERTSICSSTFDFINSSGQDSQASSIEQSLGLTLIDFELQKYRFRVPVRPIDVNPNLSLISRGDGASPNIFSQSILMSEDDVKMLKMVKVQQAIMNVPEEETQQITEKRQEGTMQNISDLTGIGVDQTIGWIKKSEGEAVSRLFTNQTMDISMEIPEAKGSKRKSEKSTKSIVIDTSTIDINSPMRKKPMRNLINDSMNVTKIAVEETSEKELIRRPTIHFESAPIEESIFYTTADIQHDCNDAVEQSVPHFSSQTIQFDNKSIIEDNTFKNIEGACETDQNISMELSLCSPSEPIHAIDENAGETQTNRRTIHYVEGGQKMECTALPSDHETVLHRTLKKPIVYTPKPELDSKVHSKTRQTIYETVNIVEEASIQNKRSSFHSKNVNKKRESNYVPSDMIESSPESVKSSQTAQASQKLNTKMRQTVFTPQDIDDHSRIKRANPIEVNAPNQQVNHSESSSEDLKVMIPINSVNKRQTTYTPFEILEDSLQPEIPNTFERNSVYVPSDIVVDEPDSTQHPEPVPHESAQLREVVCNESRKSVNIEKGVVHKSNHRESVYTAVDIVEDSPKNKKPLKPSKIKVFHSTIAARKPAQSTLQAIETNQGHQSYDNVKDIQANAPPELKKRQSVYTPVDMIEDSPKAPKQVHANAHQRESVFFPSDIKTDSHSTMAAVESHQISLPPSSSKNTIDQRKTIYTGVDMAIDTPKKISVVSKTSEHNSLTNHAKSTTERRPGDLQFRKPLQLYTSDKKTTPIPSSSTKTLQEQIMEEMGFSMNFVSSGSRKQTPLTIRQPNQKPSYFHEEFDGSISPNPRNELESSKNTKKPQNVYSINLSIEGKCHTMNYSEKLDAEDTTNSQVKNKITNSTVLDGKSMNVQRNFEWEESQIEKLNPSTTMDDVEMELSVTDVWRPNHEQIVQVNMAKSVIQTQHVQDMDATMKDNRKDCDKKRPSNRQSIYPNEDLDIENLSDSEKHVKQNVKSMSNNKKSMAAAASRVLSHETVYYNEELDMMEEDGDVEGVPRQVLAQSSKKPSRPTNYFPENVEVENHRKVEQKSDDEVKVLPRISKTPRRETIYFDQDLILEANDDEQASASKTTDRNERSALDDDIVQLKSSKGSLIRQTVPKPTCPTIYFNQDLEKDDACHQTNIKAQVEKFSGGSKPLVRKTILLNQDIGVDIQETPRTTLLIAENHVSSKARRQTIHLNEDLDIDDEKTNTKQSSRGKSKQHVEANFPGTSSSSKRQTVFLNQDLDRTNIEHNRPLVNVGKPSRQTIYFNQDVEEEKTETKQSGQEQTSNKQHQARDTGVSKRQAVFLNQDLDTTNIEHDRPLVEHKKPSRQTIYFNQDLEEEKTETKQSLREQTSNKQHEAVHGQRVTSVSKRQTVFLNQDLDTTNIEHDRPIIDVKKPSRQTIHFNQDLEEEKTETRQNGRGQSSDKQHQARDTGVSKRQTVFLNQDLDTTNIEHDRPLPDVKKPSRQTIHFNQDLEEEKTETRQNGRGQSSDKQHEAVHCPRVTSASKHQTVFFNQELDMLDIEQEDQLTSQTSKPLPKRQTLYLNQDVEEEKTMNLESSGTQPVEKVNSPQPVSVPKRQTIFLDQELDMSDMREEQEPVLQVSKACNWPLQNVEKPNRQTIYFNQDLEEEKTETGKSDIRLSRHTSHRQYLKTDLPPTAGIPERRTVFLNQDLDITDIEQKQESHPKTLFYNKDLEMKPKETYQLKSSQSLAIKSVHATDEKVDLLKTANILSRPTVFFDQNIDIADIELGQGQMPSRLLQVPQMSSRSMQNDQKANRQTMHFNQDIEEEKIEAGPVKSFDPSGGQRVACKDDMLKIACVSERPTIFFNHDLDITDIEQETQPTLQTSHESCMSSVETKRAFEEGKAQTNEGKLEARFHVTAPTSISAFDDISRQRTQKQMQPSVKDSDQQKQQQRIELSNRRTVFLNQDIELDEENFQSEDFKRNAAVIEKKLELGEKVHPKESRATNHFITNLDETGQTSRKETTSVAVLPKPKRFTTYDQQPLDIEESPQKPIIRKSSFSRTLNFDAVKTNQDQPVKHRVTWTTPPTDNISPIYNPNSRPQIFSTPAEGSRSLVEFLRVEAAANRNSQEKVVEGEEEEEDEVFYDAEDGRVEELHVNRQTTYKPVNIFEESGMQPLLTHKQKRQTTYSPEKMSEEASNERHVVKQKDTTEGVVETQGSSHRSVKQNTINPADMETKRHHLDTLKSLKESGLCRKPFDNLQLTAFTEEIEQKPKPMPNEQDNSMEISMLIECDKKPITTCRKTVYFPNENAVDASFFDENLSKPATQKNRQTQFFADDSLDLKDQMDVSQTWSKPSTALQSVREMLQENARLFTQSNTIKPSIFEEKRNTIYFANKDNSMEVSSMDYHPTEPEQSTPSKSKSNEPEQSTPSKSKSKIPQLIGSAKKMQSMKESIDFIQQELPNLGFHSKKENDFEMECMSPTEQETPRKACTSVPKKLQDSFKEFNNSRKESTLKPMQLEESFETIEIPRRALSSVPRNQNEPPKRVDTPRKVVRQLQASFNAIDFEPSGVLREKSNILQESFDTVDIPRRATTFQRNETLYLCPNEMETTTTNDLQKSQFQFEDAPITISDVSTFFARKVSPTEEELPVSCSPNSKAALCNLSLNQFQDQPKSSDSEDTTYNIAKFKKRYVELTCDSLVLSDDPNHYDIEKTHLSLVNTLDDASELVPHNACQSAIASAIEDEAIAVSSEPLKPKPSVCRKCRRHRLSVTQNDTTIENFMLEPLPVYKMNITGLQQLQNKPKISNIGKIWRQKIRESDSFNVSDGSYCTGLDETDTIDEFIRDLDSQRSVAARQRKPIDMKTQTSFIHKVWTKMQSTKSNWMLNELLLTNNIFKFTHKRLRTFAIIINSTPKDPRGIEVNFDSIELVANSFHTRKWKPFEYALHYQLLIELPFDLQSLCPNSEHLFELLDHIEKVTQDVLHTGKEILYQILSSHATLIREPSGGVYIRKQTRSKTLQNETKQIEIHIEVRNMKKLSFESIALPPLYEFDEKIQSLPIGRDFLRVFLANPSHFLKA